MINPLANVFIKNLNYHVTSKDLVKNIKKNLTFIFLCFFFCFLKERSFSLYGKVLSARVNCDLSGKNLGYGYV